MPNSSAILSNTYVDNAKIIKSKSALFKANSAVQFKLFELFQPQQAHVLRSRVVGSGGERYERPYGLVYVTGLLLQNSVVRMVIKLGIYH